MPYKIKMYGNNDCLLQYEEGSAAHACPKFFNDYDLKGSKLKVELAEKKPGHGLPKRDDGGYRRGGRGGGRGRGRGGRW